MPLGLTFDVGTRTLSGTPFTVETYDVVYKAKDDDGNDSESDAATLNFTITVRASPSACPPASDGRANRHRDHHARQASEPKEAPDANRALVAGADRPRVLGVQTLVDLLSFRPWLGLCCWM